MLWPFFLGAFRLLPLIALPELSLFGQVPVLARLGILASLAALISYSSEGLFSLPETYADALFSLAGELVLGIALAFSIHLVFGTLRFVGRLVDMQIGFAAAGIVDPTTQRVEALLGSAMAFTALVMLFSWDMHHDLVRGIAASLQAIPLGVMAITAGDPSWLAFLVGQQFLFAFMLVSPIVIGLLLLDVVIAYSSRLMPQVNVYFIALPLKIGIGLLLAALTFRTGAEPLRRLFDNAAASWTPLFSGQ